MIKVLLLLSILVLLVFQKKCFYGLKKYRLNFQKTVLLNNDNIKIINEKRKVLNILNTRINVLVDKLKRSKYKNQINVKRFVDHWNGNINEIESTFKQNMIFGYNVNKGSSIHVCLIDPVTNDIIHDYNSIMFILLHEIAHMMTKHYEHDDEFWENFSFLIEFSQNIGIYNYINYNETPIRYCGGYLNHTPYIK